jgi:hypothetical protein
VDQLARIRRVPRDHAGALPAVRSDVAEDFTGLHSLAHLAQGVEVAVRLVQVHPLELGHLILLRTTAAAVAAVERPQYWSPLHALVEAVALASAIRSKSLARPLSDIQNWRSLGGPFEAQLKRFPMQIRVPFLPTPPLWQRAGRRMLATAWIVVLLLLTLLSAGGEVLRGEESPSLLDTLLVGLAVIAPVCVIGLLSVAFGAVRDRRRGGAKEPASDTGTTDAPNVDA